MKILILAAGKGTRLGNLTKNKPKCLVEYKNTPIIDYILAIVNELKIFDVAIVNGYKKNVLENYLSNKDYVFFTNEKFDTTNMVSSFFCAAEFMDDDFILSYSDIIYKKSVLKKLASSKKDFSLIVDLNWKELWNKRFDNPLDDLEKLKIKDNKIVKIGTKAKDYESIDGQYIGLFKISKKIIPAIFKIYNDFMQDNLLSKEQKNNLQMTEFIQILIEKGITISPVYINGGWTEIDSKSDLKVEFK